MALVARGGFPVEVSTGQRLPPQAIDAGSSIRVSLSIWIDLHAPLLYKLTPLQA
jgi:hypothetical protein